MPVSPSAAAVSGPVWSKPLLNVQHQRGAGPGAGSAQGEPGLFSALCPETWEGQQCPAGRAVVVVEKLEEGT